MISFLLYFGGMAAIFAGERLLDGMALHWPVTGLGLVLVAGAIGVRAKAMGATSDAVRRRAQRNALIANVVGLASLGLYALTTDTATAAMGLDEEATARWNGTLTALWPIVWLLAAAPAALMDRVLTAHPVLVPDGALRHATQSGLIAALGICLLFPVNYLASAHQSEWDFAYFRVTRPGTSTLNVVNTLSEPVDVYLFYSPGNDVKEKVLPYFKELEAAAGGQLRLHVVDQPMAPDLAEKFTIRTNGHIVFAQGETHQKLRLQDNLDRAKRDLKKLDSMVQKHLLKIARGARTAYIMTGHGEASHRYRDSLLYKLATFKTLLQDQNYKVKEFGLADGSTVGVPEDADVVIIPGPERPLLPEEERSLFEYIDNGGAVMALVEPDRDPMTNVLEKLGLQARSSVLANRGYYVQRTRGPNDQILLYSNRFGTHDSMKALSKKSTQTAVILFTSVAVEEVEGYEGKTSALVRTFPDTWEDTNNNRRHDPDEASEVWTIAWASEGTGDKPHRAVVVGETSVISDAMIGLSEGNKQFALDTVRWLVGDEEIVGDVNSEEDVKIEHTTEDDTLWFYGTIFAIPLLILVGGMVFTRIRVKRSK